MVARWVHLNTHFLSQFRPIQSWFESPDRALRRLLYSYLCLYGFEFLPSLTDEVRNPGPDQEWILRLLEVAGFGQGGHLLFRPLFTLFPNLNFYFGWTAALRLAASLWRLERAMNWRLVQNGYLRMGWDRVLARGRLLFMLEVGVMLLVLKC